MLRLLLTRRWLGLLCLAIAAATLMVFLGRWQWARYEERSAINARVDAGTSGQPIAFTPGAPEWSRVSLTGQFDADLQILIRNRTVEGRQGWEVVTPLRLADGTAVLVDRGWVPSARSGPTALPEVPTVPSGETTIIGRVRASEPGAKPELRDGHWQSRRIGIPELGAKLPYPVAPVYVSADGDSTDLVPIPVEHENDWLNFGYAFQWWLFAAGVFWAFYWLLRREHRQLSGAPADPSASGAPADPSASGAPADPSASGASGVAGGSNDRLAGVG